VVELVAGDVRPAATGLPALRGAGNRSALT
jgi:hypothetical protein